MMLRRASPFPMVGDARYRQRHPVSPGAVLCGTNCRSWARSTSCCRGRWGGGVTRSLAIDPHGKSRSSHLLEFEIDLPE